MIKPTKILLILLAVAVVLNVSYFIDDIYNAVARSVVFKKGVVLKSNVVITAGSIDQTAGSMSTSSNAYPKSLGGVDDYNNNQTIPADAFTENFTLCNSGNNYCSTNDSVSCAGGAGFICHQDNRTNLVWSDRIDDTGDYTKPWFWANNCQYPNGLPHDDGTCDVNGEAACQCVKQPSGSETGCEALGDGNWRLPHQKELMQVYINGSWGTLPNAGNAYWSATTLSGYTGNAWRTSLYDGGTNTNGKTSSTYSRCVR